MFLLTCCICNLYVRIVKLSSTTKIVFLGFYSSLILYMYAYVCRYVCVLSRTQLFATSSIVACQAPLSMGFSRQEYRSGLPFPSPGDLPDPGTKPASGRQILCHCATYVYISHMYMKFRLFTYSNLKGEM